MRGATGSGGDEVVVVEVDERLPENVVSGKQAATVAVSSEEDGGRGETGTEQQFRGKGQYYVIVISLSKASAPGRDGVTLGHAGWCLTLFGLCLQTMENIIRKCADVGEVIGS